jgi:hypothetical protein
MIGFNGRWQHVWTLHTIGLSVQHWQLKPKMQDTENQRDMQARGQIKDLKREQGWSSDLSIKIVSSPHPPSYPFKYPVFIHPTTAPAPNNQPSAPGTHFPALPSSSSGYFNCGKSGNFIKDCPYPKQNKSNYQ